MSTPAKVLYIAREELGTKEVPLGSNTGPMVLQYQRATWLGGTRWPWCIAWCQWVFREAGVPFPYRGAGAYLFLNWARQQGWARTSPEVGDVAIFNIGSGHGAIVKSFSATHVTTIDGNVSHMVAERVRPRSTVRGYIRHPKLHDQKEKLPPQPKPPLWEIVGGESGKTKVVFVGTRKSVAKKLAGLFNKYGGITVRRKRK